MVNLEEGLGSWHKPGRAPAMWLSRLVNQEMEKSLSLSNFKIRIIINLKNKNEL